MTQENLESLKRGYEEFNRSYQMAPGVLDPSIEVIPPAEWPDAPDAYHGPEGLRSYLGEVMSVIDGYQAIPERFVEKGETIVVLAREQGRSRESEMDVQTHLTAHVWTFRGERAVRMQVCWDRDEALRAAGLSRLEAQS